MNTVCLTGYLNFEPEVKISASGKEFLSNVIGVREDYKGVDGKYKYNNIRFSAFGNTAGFIGDYVKKGDKIEIVGKINAEQVDGNYRQNVIVSSVSILQSKSQNDFSRDFKEEIPDIF
ncbi:single-stranded DNA-binding protein [Anaerofustis sp.]|uniref:single-stranded DNA-binding protein n=1 Tax=Anaerofustis sp. TaxID=1872517 RepID=UPI0025C213B6|nr:single-stranded DNA-binding protein [Anaerofustis sp.]